MAPDTVLRTAYLGNASVGVSDVKLIPCSIILNDVALPISSPSNVYGMTVASAFHQNQYQIKVYHLVLILFY